MSTSLLIINDQNSFTDIYISFRVNKDILLYKRGIFYARIDCYGRLCRSNTNSHWYFSVYLYQNIIISTRVRRVIADTMGLYICTGFYGYFIVDASDLWIWMYKTNEFNISKHNLKNIDNFVNENMIIDISQCFVLNKMTKMQSKIRNFQWSSGKCDLKLSMFAIMYQDSI